MNFLSTRIWPFFLFSASFVILVLAYMLEPDSSGVGTHQQLGLEPCGFLSSFEIPCMMCGMTTSFSLYMHVQIWEGVLNQPFSLILFGGTLYTCCLSLLDLLNPRARVSRFLDLIQNANRTWYAFALMLFLAAWLFKIFIHAA